MKEKSRAYISIVAIVAIVAIVIMVVNSGPAPVKNVVDEQGNIVGQAGIQVAMPPTQAVEPVTDHIGSVKIIGPDEMGRAPVIDDNSPLLCNKRIPLDYYNNHITQISNENMGIIVSDYCTSDDEIREYYCNIGEELKNKYYTCKYGCEDGECHTWKDELEAEDCYDSDRFADDQLYEKGTVRTNNAQKTDFCFYLSSDLKIVEVEKGEYLTEYFCTEEYNLYYNRLRCENGCVDGACITYSGETERCTDTDGGDERFEYGTVRVGDEVTGVSDECFDLDEGLNIIPVDSGEYLTEYKCIDASRDFTRYKCIDGCVNGTCVEVEE